MLPLVIKELHFVVNICFGTFKDLELDSNLPEAYHNMDVPGLLVLTFRLCLVVHPITFTNVDFRIFNILSPLLTPTSNCILLRPLSSWRKLYILIIVLISSSINMLILIHITPRN
jgi:hypothetical protein